jgi:hypothetical protein
MTGPGFVVEGGILNRDLATPFRAIAPKNISAFRVIGQRAEKEPAPFGVLEDSLNVISYRAPIVVANNARAA